jgi:hypothetical protein
MNRVSFEGKESIDLASVIAEFPNGDDNPHKIPVKKLSQVFDGCIQNKTTDHVDDHMKVYLRVRPIPNNAETTIIVESENTILTNAPESSKRALYTKLESRHYVSVCYLLSSSKLISFLLFSLLFVDCSSFFFV